MKFTIDESSNWPHVRFGDTETWTVTDHGRSKSDMTEWFRGVLFGVGLCLFLYGVFD